VSENMTPIRPLRRLFVVAALAAASASCGSVARSGDSPMFLVVNSLTGSRGGTTAGTASVPLFSEVLTNVTSPAPCTTTAPCPTIFADTGTVVLGASLKDIGNTATPSAPTTNNQITITRYHVAYVRADGQNVEGVDVPYAFDGAATGTITATGGTLGTLSLTFELVRNVAKAESPLVQLVTSSTVLAVIANVTFYGTDQVGNGINVTGSISIEFGYFGGF
jgi:hypothetical protein